MFSGFGLVYVALLMILWGAQGSDDICTGSGKPAKRPDICPLVISDPTSVSPLPCDRILCSAPRFHYCRLDVQSTRHPNLLEEFNVSQCTTQLTQTVNFLGLKFSWRIADDAGSLGDLNLSIAVEHRDYPREEFRLNVKLTNQIAAHRTVSSTTCLPLLIVLRKRTLYVKARVIQSRNIFYEELQRSLTLDYSCSNILTTLQDVCPAPPDFRPIPRLSCEDGSPSVKVKFDTSPPPGVGSKLTYNVGVALQESESEEIIKSKIKMENTKVKPYEPSADFHEVPAGTYVALFAFLDNNDQPCGDAYYTSSEQVTIKAPPDFRPIPRLSCEDGSPSVKVTFDTSSPSGVGSELTYNIRVALQESESQRRLESEIVKMDNMKVKSYEQSVDFHGVPAGTYVARLVFLDDDPPCGDTYNNSSEQVTIKGNECGMDLWLLMAIAGFALMVLMIILVCVTLCVTKYKQRSSSPRPSVPLSVADTSWMERIHNLYVLRGGTTAPSDIQLGVGSVVTDRETRIPGELSSLPDQTELYMMDSDGLDYNQQPTSWDSGWNSGYDDQSCTGTETYAH